MTSSTPFLLTRVLSGLCLCLVACGPEKKDDDGGFRSAGVTADTACAAECNRQQRCPDPAVTPPTPEECIATCRARLGTAPAYRSDVIDALGGCYQTLACGAGDDCSSQAVLVVTSSPENDPQVKACLAQQQACATAGTPFVADLCRTRLMLIPSAQTAFDVCLSKACAEIAACIDTVVGRTQ